MNATAESVDRQSIPSALNLSALWRSVKLPTRLLRFVPISDLIALLILFWMLWMLGWTVQLAGWGDLPNIVPTLVLGASVAFVMSKARVPWPLNLLVFLAAGTIVVFWQGSIPAEGANPLARSIDAWNRFSLWIDIAINGGVSGDSVPFSMLFMTTSWIVSYSVAALTFRFYSPWIPVLMLGLCLLTILSHRQGLHEQTFYLFMIGAIAQFSHLVAVRRLNSWRRANLSTPRDAMWIAARDGLLLGMIVMFISFVLPLAEPRSDTLRDGWNRVFLEPLAKINEVAERLLAGVPSGDRDLLDTPNAVMPFQGGIQLTDEVIMWIRSRYALLHPGRVYQQYTSSGWISAPSVGIQASSRSQLAANPAEMGIHKRDLVQMTIQPAGGTDLVIPAAAVHTVDYGVEVEILEPLAWDVPLVGDPAGISEMPEDLREMAYALRFRLADIASQRVPGTQFTFEDHPPLDPVTVAETISQIRETTEAKIDENALVELTFFTGDYSVLQTIDPDDIDPSIPVRSISSDELIGFLREDFGEENYQGLIRVPLTLKQLTDLRSDAVAQNSIVEATLLEEFERFVRDGMGAENSIDWDSFSYRIFVEPDLGGATFLRIVRHGPSEQNTVKFANFLEKNHQYHVATYVSTAEDEDLAESSDEYPYWITDRYLQIPITLPTRVRQLSRDVVAEANAETPWEKVQAIKKFLQSQVYSLEIEGPGPFQDGLDYFLFETVGEPCPSDSPNCDESKIKGYSQYFGSAGTMMLRSTGVPARMIAGWSAGDYAADQGQFVIRDSDRHGWTQAYMPPYGWIDIEVTPGRPAVPRNVRVPTVPFSQIPPEIVGSAEFDPDFMEDLEYLESLALEAREFLARRRAEEAQAQGAFDWPVPWVGVASAGSLLIILTILVGTWQWNLRGRPPAVKAYIQFARIAALAGYRRGAHHSVREYADRLSNVSGQFRNDAEFIVGSYERTVYGGDKGLEESSIAEVPEERQFDDTVDQEVLDDEPPKIDGNRELTKAWRRMARAVAAYRLARLLRLKPPLRHESS